ncbi:MAG: helix-turn-helix transcriptional regulator [Bacillaceae bacterium]|nr:helix-turn-helix transcriptional regulator [Bacillaceae bacterium]
MEAHRMGYRIRSYRKLKRYTQQDLADKLGISISVLGTIERGMTEPDEKILRRIADILEVSYEELCDIES